MTQEIIPRDPSRPYLIGDDPDIPFSKFRQPISLFDTDHVQEKYAKWASDYATRVSEEGFWSHKKEKNIHNFSGCIIPSFGHQNNKLLYKEGSKLNIDKLVWATFAKEAFFHNVEFEGGGVFAGVKFQGNTTFINSSFRGKNFFHEAELCSTGILNFRGRSGSSPDGWWEHEPFAGLNVREGGKIILRSCNFPDGFTLRELNLNETYFAGSNIEKIRFISCYFPEGGGRLMHPSRLKLADETTDETDVSDSFPIPDQKISMSEMAVMYQLMKKSFEDQKEYQTAGKFYISEMFYREKIAWHSKRYVKAIIFSLYRIFAGYGESVERTVAFLLFLILLLVPLLAFLSTLISVPEWIKMIFSHEPLLSIKSSFRKILLLKEGAGWGDIFSRILFIPALFLFVNAIRRRLRRS